MSNNTNPYAGAANAYGDHAQKSTSDPRELEARVLLKSANMLQDLQNNWNPENLQKLDEVLTYNRQIWMIFFDTAVENKENDRPDELRSNIINLATFVFNRTIDILGNPDKSKLEALITINRNIAEGLLANTKASAAQGGSPSSPGSATTTSA